MSDAIRAGLLRRLLRTPLTDLLCLRLDDGRPVAASPADDSAVPAELHAFVARVVRRTRLWHREKVDVASELRAHFADGLTAGATPGELVEAFGDERRAARLIRRAKIRNRPLLWHVLWFSRRAVAVLVLTYAALAARFFLSSPTVSVDYLTTLNAPARQAPEDRRAWPLYARALADLNLPGVSSRPTGETEDTRRLQQFERMLDAKPGWRHWAELSSWLDGHSAAIDLARRAAAKPAFGFVLGSDGSQLDAPLNIDERSGGPLPLVGVLLPALSPMRHLANALSADAALAREREDGDRVVRDVEAILGMAEHLRGQFHVNQLVAMGFDRIALDQLDQTLAANPQLLSDAASIRVAHRLSQLGVRTPLVDLRGERLFFYDVLQRSFTDDGTGDGRLTAAGTTFLHGVTSAGDADGWGALPLELIGPIGVIAPRREQRAEYDRLMDVQEAQRDRPAPEADYSTVHARVRELRTSPSLHVRYLPVAIMLPAMGRSAARVDTLLGKRDGVLVAVALEVHRRRHGGVYPATLEELVPSLLPAVPADRITGDPVRYRVVDGKPVVYSVGVDRKDDGGRRPAGGGDDPAAKWPHLDFPPSTLAPGQARQIAPGDQGDWILYPGLAEKVEPSADN